MKIFEEYKNLQEVQCLNKCRQLNYIPSLLTGDFVLLWSVGNTHQS